MPTEGPSKGGNSSNLYLVTFLATLFLLLFVSCAIVLRSYLLRRRFHRRVEQALAQGIVLAPRAPGSRKRRYGLRPTLYENWVAPLHVSGVSGCQLPHNALGGRWVDMLPLTVQTVVVKRRTRESVLSPTSSPLTAQSPENQPLHPFAPQASNGVPNASDLQPQGRLGSFFSRFSSTAQSPPAAPTDAVAVAFPGGSETPPVRERRESTAMANWRTIVTPSPSLVMAGGGAVDAARARSLVRSTPGITPTPGDRRSRRMSLPASPIRPNANALGGSDGNAGASTPSLFSVLRGRRNSTIAVTGSTHEQPPPLPSPLPSQVRSPEQNVGQSVNWTLAAPPESSSSNGVAPTNRTRTRININTNLPPPTAATVGISATGTAVTPTAIQTAITPGTGLGKTRIRTEMLQISVLVAMPDIRTSALYGDAGVVKQNHRKGSGKGAGIGSGGETAREKEKRRTSGSGVVKTKEDEDEDADEIVEVPGDDDSSSISSTSSSSEEGETGVQRAPCLPELVLGVTRLTYRHTTGNVVGLSPSGNPPFVIPTSPPPPPPIAGDVERLTRQLIF